MFKKNKNVAEATLDLQFNLEIVENNFHLN